MKVSSNLAAIETTGISQRVAANNLANMRSDGFKRGITVQGSASSVSVRSDTGQGALIVAGNGFSVAVNGQGYLPLKLSNGETSYSRGASLAVSKNGTLTDRAGNAVVPGIQLPTSVNAVSVDNTGVVSATDLSGQRKDYGQLQLAVFANPGALAKVGNGMLLATKGSGSALLNAPGNGVAGSLLFGASEQSNVAPASDMVTMMINQVTMAYNVKAIQVQEQMSQVGLSIKA
ncbi:MAG: flagellar hook basal-body protein [Mariprofundales bacterium]|nr:flagellar hook basal-body protein [Mariprofundales bacterium]